ncbi:LysR family transcriptional regulator [Rhizobium leguminosarum]|uniref:HTH-type transcriptional regulator TtuA n=1 Tax=Rhizobium leguminosarum bv. trifolii TaxID=386 RepID=A0A1B8REJ1_RHILT|nr:LysR family transcriptional regulator [Rhizobium leguminosarum]AOO89960.1 LysR family transcriptional regulator [Rhizobium leguminosarum bv. trifolii]OBY07161.1 LysR family transcriptional regulator [Rhizobium leguminosarum bv. trifolii]TBE54381.1 LysR family transcriptional regulator [Rhizobium leguminosarum]TBE92026.1 LysR family transcriptional regulator [Rhizobium leguminosarum]TBZ70234.1 LysR family transcriptional regulator [Rhizobium leguminosarum bv. viciae]
MLPNPTLDQLQVFLTVAETGSFSAASRALNRAQSVVSYTIANLEAQLEVPLFERSGARQPKLTEAGKAMLEDARRILGDLQVMRARVKSLREGLEAEVSVAISVMVPSRALVEVLREFREMFPSVSLNLNVGELGMVMDLVLSGKATIGIGGAVLKQDDSVVTERIGHSFMLPVAARNHPLVAIDRPLMLGDVREEVQLVVTDASGLTKGRDFNVLSYKTWRVSDIATKHQLIKAGLGWGGLPASLIRDDLVSGALVPLDLDAYEQGEYAIYSVRQLANPPGPAATWIIDAFRTRLSACPSHADFNAQIAELREPGMPLAAE